MAPSWGHPICDMDLMIFGTGPLTVYSLDDTQNDRLQPPQDFCMMLKNTESHPGHSCIRYQDSSPYSHRREKNLLISFCTTLLMSTLLLCAYFRLILLVVIFLGSFVLYCVAIITVFRLHLRLSIFPQQLVHLTALSVVVLFIVTLCRDNSSITEYYGRVRNSSSAPKPVLVHTCTALFCVTIRHFMFLWRGLLFACVIIILMFVNVCLLC